MSEIQVHLTTRDAARLIDVHESSVKRWCNAGDLACLVTEGGHRRIPLDQLLSFARSQGLSCSLLALSPREGEVWQALVQAERRGVFAPLAALAHRWLAEAEPRLPVQLFLLCRQMGLPLAHLFDLVMAPVMHRVGEDWYNGLADVGDEHRMTQVMFDAMHAMRCALGPDEAPRERIALVGCEEGNLHELGAQMVRMVLEEAGWRTVYLGPNVPTEDVAAQQVAHGASLVCLSTVPPSAPSDTRRLLRALARHYESAQPYRLALGGAAAGEAPSLEVEDYPFVDCRIFHSIEAFSEWLPSLS